LRPEVAVVATDIVGSSTLWEAHPDVAGTVVDLHNRVLRDAMRQFGGYEIRTEGDAFLVLFRDCVSAMLACLEAQQALAETRWPPPCNEEGGVKVRMGIHWASVHIEHDPVTGRMDVRGPATRRAQRVAEAAHGGQVLLSAGALAALRGGSEITGIRLTPLGRWLLSDSDQPEDLWLTEFSDVAPTRWPPPRGRPAPSVPHNLPRERPILLGRQRELEWLDQRLRDGRRALLVHGLAGVGKTALVSHLVSGLVDERSPVQLRGGVWRLDLSAARTASEASNAALALLRSSADRVATASSIGHGLEQLGDALVVMDQADGLISVLGELVRDWLTEAPRLRVLAVARAPAAWEGWAALQVDPLPFPDVVPERLENEDVEALRQDPSVALLLRRGDAARDEPGLLDTPANLQTLARIARALGGLPLALEIAASWLSLLSPSALEEHMQRDLFGLLQDRPGTTETLPRAVQRAMHETWVSIPELARAQVARLSVARGGLSELSAGELMSGLLGAGGAGTRAALDLLRGRGLLCAVVTPEGPVRWAVPPLLAACAKDLGGEHAEAAHTAHRRFYADLARQVLEIDPIWRPSVVAAMLVAEAENLDAAMEAAREQDDRADLRDLGLARLEVTLLQGPVRRGLDLAQELRAICAGDSRLLAHLEVAHGRLCRWLGRDEEAERALELGARSSMEQGDLVGQLRATRALVEIYLGSGRAAQAGAAVDMALSAARLTGATHVEAAARSLRAAIHRHMGRWQAALDDHSASMDPLSSSGSTPEQAAALLERARLAADMGDPSLAIELCHDATDLLAALEDRLGLSRSCELLGRLYWLAARDEEAIQELRAASYARRLTGIPEEAGLLWTLGAATAELGQLETARAAFTDAEDAIWDRGPRSLLIPTLLARAEIEMRLHGAGEARAWVERAERRARSADRREEAWLCLARGRRMLMLGDRVEAAGAAQEARDLLDAQPDADADRALRPLERAIWSRMDLHSSTSG